MKISGIEIQNFPNLIASTDFDIIHKVFLYPSEMISKSTIAYLSFDDRKIKLRFDLDKYSEINEDNFLYVSETDILFYAGCKEWCAFDLKNFVNIRHEEAFDLPFFYKRDDVILIYGELLVESTDLHAIRIDQVPVDPPYDEIEFEDRIEFNSSIYGKQILKIKKSL